MQIDKREVLYFLGYRGQDISDELNNLIDTAIQTCIDLSKPKFVLKKFELEFSPLRFKNTNFELYGKDILEHLKDCDFAYAFAVTLGFDLDKEVEKQLTINKTFAVILDSCGSACIESVCDDICNDLLLKEKELTTRFSCGYGDFPIECQKDLCDLLNAQKNIGLFVNKSFSMSPNKSVTAIVGVKRRLN